MPRASGLVGAVVAGLAAVLCGADASGPEMPLMLGVAAGANIACESRALPKTLDAVEWAEAAVAQCTLPDVVDVIVLEHDSMHEGHLLNVKTEGVFAGKDRWTNLHAQNVPAALIRLKSIGTTHALDYKFVTGVEAAIKVLTEATKGEPIRLVVTLPTPTPDAPAPDLASVTAKARNAALVVITGRKPSFHGLRGTSVNRRREAIEEVLADEKSYYYIDSTIWMGIIAALVFTILLAISVHCLWGIQTPTHFDDPKSQYGIQLGLVEAE